MMVTNGGSAAITTKEIDWSVLKLPRIDLCRQLCRHGDSRYIYIGCGYGAQIAQEKCYTTHTGRSLGNACRIYGNLIAQIARHANIMLMPIIHHLCQQCSYIHHHDNFLYYTANG